MDARNTDNDQFMNVWRSKHYVGTNSGMITTTSNYNNMENSQNSKREFIAFSTNNTQVPNSIGISTTQEWRIVPSLMGLTEAVFMLNDIAQAQYRELHSIRGLLESLLQKDKDNLSNNSNVLEEIESKIIELFKQIDCLQSVLVENRDGLLLTTFLHTDEDRVRISDKIIDKLIELEDNFPNINFEPSILHVNDKSFDKFSGKRITFR
ncbi:hypothetical protein [Candidatus Nitrosocosmicus sp. SS]|jgi:hypothetical protein|uniref:hypothetical protein n=1 Tax=Candidatus Nitrosocosmicus agrestis TaxID=2563600 RepID=UPI00122E9428|nr:hypothetical protein [Candidatus Nitrosocosmicus sp. SS]KAA2283741.1 hypothetical protein F1Z66_00165 [Candidatus Nitrosocosmicus sp. SS]KAF0870117.1 hypothetical protein E5N71_00890 [Candidatus Nitrosocosmicus sp. SS]